MGAIATYAMPIALKALKTCLQGVCRPAWLPLWLRPPVKGLKGLKSKHTPSFQKIVPALQCALPNYPPCKVFPPTPLNDGPKGPIF